MRNNKTSFVYVYPKYLPTFYIGIGTAFFYFKLYKLGRYCKYIITFEIKSYFIKQYCFFCLELMISITSKLIWFSILGKLHICPLMVLGYLFFRFKSCLSQFKLFYQQPLSDSLNTESLNAKGASAGYFYNGVNFVTWKLFSKKLVSILN